MKRKTRISIIVVSALLAIVVMFFVPPIPQPVRYHDFADQRGWLGIPNALDVFSNIGFLIVGAWGVWSVLRASAARRPLFGDRRERWPWLALFAGTALTAFGSAYYHWAPSNKTLVWDRLPMAVAAMSLLAAVLAERVDVKAGLRWLPLLLAVGVASVAWWAWSEQRGAGDLRAYGLVQFLPLLLIPLLILFFPPRYSHTGGYFGAIGWYIAAKIAEHLDERIFSFGGLVSGHTLKHLLAAVGFYWVLRMLLLREPLSTGQPVATRNRRKRR